jgi:hypothetical protein
MRQQRARNTTDELISVLLCCVSLCSARAMSTKNKGNKKKNKGNKKKNVAPKESEQEIVAQVDQVDIVDLEVEGIMQAPVVVAPVVASSFPASMAPPVVPASASSSSSSVSSELADMKQQMKMLMDMMKMQQTSATASSSSASASSAPSSRCDSPAQPGTPRELELQEELRVMKIKQATELAEFKKQAAAAIFCSCSRGSVCARGPCKCFTGSKQCTARCGCRADPIICNNNATPGVAARKARQEAAAIDLSGAFSNMSTEELENVLAERKKQKSLHIKHVRVFSNCVRN